MPSNTTLYQVIHIFGIWLQCFDPLLDHHQAYIKTRKCITFYILRAKRDSVWFTELYTACTGSDEEREN
jgi:hypothetical protein